MILQLLSALALLAAPHGNDAEDLSPDVEATLRYSEQLYDLHSAYEREYQTDQPKRTERQMRQPFQWSWAKNKPQKQPVTKTSQLAMPRKPP